MNGCPESVMAKHIVERSDPRKPKLGILLFFCMKNVTDLSTRILFESDVKKQKIFFKSVLPTRVD